MTEDGYKVPFGVSRHVAKAGEIASIDRGWIQTRCKAVGPTASPQEK